MRLRNRWLDALWLLALSAYILAGVPIASFHGDETANIYNARDYIALFIERQPSQLLVFSTDDASEGAFTRLIDGGAARYSIGLALHLSGFTAADLPLGVFYDFDLTFVENQALGLVPDQAVLGVARVAISLFLAGSTALMFALGALYGGRPAGYLASLLFALHPVLLLNGRRAMQESPLLFFGLLTILCAALISRRREQQQPIPLMWWLGLAVCAALAVVSKQTGLLFVLAAFAWLLLTEILHFRWRATGALVLRLAACAGLAFTFYVALSPALWTNPIARLQDAAFARLQLMMWQTRIVPDAPSPLSVRLTNLVTQPFIAPLVQREIILADETPALIEQFERYQNSPLSGVQFGMVLGVPLTMLAVVGLLSGIGRFVHSSRALTNGAFAWWLVSAGAMLANPLPWQRYLIPYFPVVILFAAMGLLHLARWANSTLGKTRAPVPDSYTTAHTAE